MAEIYLKDLLNENKSAFLAASKQLLAEDTKLNCLGVDNLSKKQFQWLFNSIPKDNTTTEIGEYVDIHTASESFLTELASYIKSHEYHSNQKSDRNLDKYIIWATAFLVFSTVGVLSFLTNHEQDITHTPVTPIRKVEQYQLNTKSITIGILGKRKRYESLIKYLQSKLGDSVKIILDGEDDLPYQVAINRIQLKQWDLAFTLSPTISIAAEDSGYIKIARMFAHRSPYYQSVLFVNQDSEIDSIDDLLPTTTVALGSNDSASSFYIPMYYLYGKRLTIDLGNRGEKIKDMVRNGKADVGAAAYDDREPYKDLKIIHQSMNIPSSSVYLSPKLTESDRKIISTLLNNAPAEVKNKDQANYGDPETQIDYTGYRTVINNVEKIITCTNFTINPVNLFCTRNQEYLEIEGKINGWSSRRNKYIINFTDTNKIKYKIYLDRKLLTKIVGKPNPIPLNNRKVKIKYVATENKRKITINNPLQLKILPEE